LFFQIRSERVRITYGRNQNWPSKVMVG